MFPLGAFKGERCTDSVCVCGINMHMRLLELPCTTVRVEAFIQAANTNATQRSDHAACLLLVQLENRGMHGHKVTPVGPLRAHYG